MQPTPALYSGRKQLLNADEGFLRNGRPLSSRQLRRQLEHPAFFFVSVLFFLKNKNKGNTAMLLCVRKGKKKACLDALAWF
jgi:hypothetical protein